MRTDEQKRTMINAIMHQRERLPRTGENGEQHHTRADTLVGIINGTISEDQVEDLELDDKLSEVDAETCRNAFGWLQGDDDVTLVDEEDLLAVAPVNPAAPAAEATGGEEDAAGGQEEGGAAVAGGDDAGEQQEAAQ